MDLEFFLPLKELFKESGWYFNRSSEYRGRDEMYVLKPLDDLETEGGYERTRVHAFTKIDYTADGPRFRITFRLDAEAHAEVRHVVFYLPPVKKVYRFPRKDFEELAAEARSGHFGWVYDEQRGYRANLYSDSDELHPVGEDGSSNSAHARIPIARFLLRPSDPQRDRKTGEPPGSPTS